MILDKRKLIYSILKELEKGNEPKFSDYGVDKDLFGDTIEMMQNGDLISGAKVIREGKKVKFTIISYTKVELEGLNYLEENSALSKTYRGLKEVVSWLKP